MLKSKARFGQQRTFDQEVLTSTFDTDIAGLALVLETQPEIMARHARNLDPG